MVGIPDKLWKAILYFFYLLIFFLLFLFCEKSPSPLLSGQVRLTAEEVGVTEVWLGVQTAHIIGEFSLKVWRDDTCIFRGVFSGADTTVYDSRLRPAHRYRYRARLERNGHPVLESAPLEITTMDTTSHEFTWEIIEIPSPYGSGVLYDVAIINENDIWAVGEIYADSIQPWLPYNAVHWVGQRWELKRIKTNACGGVDYPPIEAIFAFAANDILFAHIDGSITHFNGISFVNDCRLITELNGSVKKMWGKSRNDLYVVSGNGFIAHYDGSRWQKLESGTELPIQDIWGARNEKTGEYEILCVASDKYHNLGKKILRIKEDTTYPIPDAGLSWSLSSIWFISNSRYYVAGNGIFEKRRLTDPFWKNKPGDFTPYYTFKIRGYALNNIWATGGFGEVLHFNGNSWRSFFNSTHLAGGNYYSLDLTENMVIVVGYNSPNAVIAIGKP